MLPKIMLLPSKDPKNIRLLAIPEDIENHEAYRHATGLIARVQEESATYSWEDIAEVLEERGYRPLEFVIGPEIE